MEVENHVTLNVIASGVEKNCVKYAHYQCQGSIVFHRNISVGHVKMNWLKDYWNQVSAKTVKQGSQPQRGRLPRTHPEPREFFRGEIPIFVGGKQTYDFSYTDRIYTLCCYSVVNISFDLLSTFLTFDLLNWVELSFLVHDVMLFVSKYCLKCFPWWP